ncbi:acyl-CoA dehydrogenase [Kitasatospora sp. GAS1066B]|uniref:acyl-CoA dehydrogenase family protein n=1 Tax=Kitasatospora sp. GAS1066B TaxID=3156271 RepID=UPI003514BB06
MTPISGRPNPIDDPEPTEQLTEQLAAQLTDRLAGLLKSRRLATEPDPLADDLSAHLMLRQLAATLPPAAEVLADPALLAALSAATALADPPLYQTFLSHYILCAGSVALLGSPDADPGGDLAHARAKGSFLVTELGDASSHLGIRTTARFDPAAREFTLHTPDPRAAKFSSVAARGLPQKAAVCARLICAGQDAGVFSFLVDLTDERGRPVPGVSISSPITLDALPLPYAAVRFQQLRLPYRSWLRDGAVLTPDGTLHDAVGGAQARLRRTLSVGQALWATLPSAMAALAARSAVLTWRFSVSRRSHGGLAPGAPVLAYRTQQHAVLGALAEALALRRAAAQALAGWAAGAPSVGASHAMTFSPWAAVDPSLALHKALATRSTARLVGECQHRCGVSGFFAINRLSGYLGLARAFENAGGDNTLILLDAGRALAERPPDQAPPPPPTDLTDPAWWPRAAAVLRHRLAAELHADLRRHEAQGTRDLTLWNPLLDQALRLGEVAAQGLAADAVAAAPASATEPATAGPRDPLTTLAALYGLVQARRLSGPLLAAELLTPGAARRLPAAMDQLCDELTPQLPAIAEALDPGAAGADVPLGAPDYAAALGAALDWPRGAR